jgi:hypothetical protein
VVEHKNRHLLDVAGALLFHMHVPKQLWSDVLIACYLINRMLSSFLDGNSPHSLFFSSSSYSCHLRFLGASTKRIIWVLVIIRLILVLLNVFLGYFTT